MLIRLLISGLVIAVAAAQDPAPAKPASAIPEDTEIVTLDSGLKYSVLKAGTGNPPNVGDHVKVHYTGWLTDGTKFDSSRDRGDPFTFTLGKGQVIAGWDAGVALMSEGARFKLTIPPELGYGGQSQGAIPPNSTLVFDVELLEVIVLPTFPKPDPAKQQKTETGFVYETLREGTGAVATDEQIVELRYAMFSPEGNLLEATETTGRTLRGQTTALPVPFLTEAVRLMREGGRLRLEVPSKAFNPRRANLPPESTTIWQLDLVKVSPMPKVPDFVMPPADKLQKTASGLQYEVVKLGTGPKPAAKDTVTVHYAGWLTEGKLFDSSYGRGETTSFGLQQVIRGWTEGLQLMPEGSVYRFVIPPDLAYGPRGAGATIPPNATLVFLVDLVKINR